LRDVTSIAPHHLPELNIAGGFRAIARKNMSASKPSNEIKNQAAESYFCFGNQSLSEGIAL
jgi:hypothetical protein